MLIPWGTDTRPLVQWPGRGERRGMWQREETSYVAPGNMNPAGKAECLDSSSRGPRVSFTHWGALPSGKLSR